MKAIITKITELNEFGHKLVSMQFGHEFLHVWTEHILSLEWGMKGDVMFFHSPDSIANNDKVRKYCLELARNYTKRTYTERFWGENDSFALLKEWGIEPQEWSTVNSVTTEFQNERPKRRINWAEVLPDNEVYDHFFAREVGDIPSPTFKTREVKMLIRASN